MTEQFTPAEEPLDQGPEASGEPTDVLGDLEALVAERTADLQRVQAEYVNYKRRVDRDRELARAAGVEAVLGDLLPVLDAIGAAKLHNDYAGPFKLLGDEIEKVATRHGLTAYGAQGDRFDPQIHDALMHMQQPGITETTCVEVPQVGYRVGDRILRPARVVVADPEDASADEAPEDASAQE